MPDAPADADADSHSHTNPNVCPNSNADPHPHTGPDADSNTLPDTKLRRRPAMIHGGNVMSRRGQSSSAQRRSLSKMTFRRLILGAYSALALLGPMQSAAQSTLSPPRQDSNSPTGVSYRNGTLSISEQDLSIGGDGPTGLSLRRNYISSVTSDGPGANWTFGVQGFVSVEPIPIYPDFEQPQPGDEPYVYNVAFGDKSIGFTGGSTYTGQYGSHTGGPVGPYQPAAPSGAQLVFNGSNPNTGNYTLTDADGTVINFNPGPNGRIANWTMPDGTRLDYSYQAGGYVVKAVTSNRGWALLFESATKVCAVNMAQTYVTATSSCPTGAQTVTYGTSAGTFNPYTQLLTSVTRGGNTTTYAYNGKDHLNCVKEPGQTVCKIQTTYAECANDPQVSGTQNLLHLHDYVTSQQDASGKTYAFAYANAGSAYPVNCPQWRQDTDGDYRPFTSSTATLTENGSITTSVLLGASGLPLGITNPLGKTSSYVLGAVGSFGVQDTTVNSVITPEGTREDYLFDDRGNVTSKTVQPKPGSGLSNIVTSASFPSSCTNIKTCNKPTYVIDARGKQTDFTYDATHGGVLTETAPADTNGIRAVKRYAYTQRYAWLKNSGGTYTQASTPVWVMTEMRTCRTTATVSGACAGGASDEVVTLYEYGPDTGATGNNLLLRGVAVTAYVGGTATTLRTCYGYDRDGNKISETKPRAGLTVCS